MLEEDLYDRLVSYASTKHSLKMTDRGRKKPPIPSVSVDIAAIYPACVSSILRQNCRVSMVRSMVNGKRMIGRNFQPVMRAFDRYIYTIYIYIIIRITIFLRFIVFSMAQVSQRMHVQRA